MQFYVYSFSLYWRWFVPECVTSLLKLSARSELLP